MQTLASASVFPKMRQNPSEWLHGHRLTSENKAFGVPGPTSPDAGLGDGQLHLRKTLPFRWPVEWQKRPLRDHQNRPPLPGIVETGGVLLYTIFAARIFSTALSTEV